MQNENPSFGISRLERLLTLSAIKDGSVKLNGIFHEVPKSGAGDNYVICNSVPKSGTYLILELVKAIGLHADTGYHLYSEHINKIRPDGYIENKRDFSSIISVSAMEPGYTSAAHIEYCPLVEQLMLNNNRHKMLFIIRDPRDIIISWVDFVYGSTSYAKMRPLNAYQRRRGMECYPDDESRIEGTIKSIAKTEILNFIGWINSPACFTIRFEDLYDELIHLDDNNETPTIDAIIKYLEVPVPPSRETLKSILGKGLTSTDRESKVGIYKTRMSRKNMGLLLDPEIQKIVLEYGYEETVLDPSEIVSSGESEDERLAAVLDQLKAELSETRDRVTALQHEYDNTSLDRDAARRECERLTRECERLTEACEAYEKSLSWKATAALRIASRLIRGK